MFQSSDKREIHCEYPYKLLLNYHQVLSFKWNHCLNVPSKHGKAIVTTLGMIIF